jgi:hypothetical protein
MRARVIAVLAMAAATTAVAGVAGAKEIGVNLSSPPAHLAAGQTWTARLTTFARGRPAARPGAHPTVTIKRTGRLAMPVGTFRPRALGHPGRYAVDIVFPAAGRWVCVVTGVGQGEWQFRPIRVTPPR